MYKAHTPGDQDPALETEEDARRLEKKIFPLFTNAWHVGSGRHALTEVKTAEQFVELWEKGDFKWQREGLEKPESFPTLETMKAILKIYEDNRPKYWRRR